MSNLLRSFFQVVVVLSLSIPFAGYAQSVAAASAIEYHFPLDGSSFVPTNSAIIVRPSLAVDRSSVSSSAFRVSGSMSGVHAGSVKLSDDGKTLVFQPSERFAVGEQVTVQLENIRTTDGQIVESKSFSFDISPTEHATQSNNSVFVEDQSPISLDAPASLPSDWPQMTVLTNDHPAAGDLFVASFSAATGAGSNHAYRMILDSLANPVYYAKPARMLDFDFKVLPNGRLAFCEGGYVAGSQAIIDAGTKYYIMDSNYTVVDSFDMRRVSSSYVTDFHDIQILPNGHALMLGVDTIPNWNMSKDLPGAKSNALFVGAVIEEVDNSINSPVWVWRSWDAGHYLDTDAVNENANLMGPVVDAVHANSIQQDTDGNILLSSRHLDEVSKINRSDANGSFIWRLGGKHNQFTFVNDSIHFSHQHDARRISNGNLTLFDNGNYRHFAVKIDTLIDSSITPPDTMYDTAHKPFARACEYHLDMSNMTATLVWHYDHDSTIESTAMGSVQRLDNGNSLVCWGLAFNPGIGFVDQPNITEVRPDKSIAYELHMVAPVYTYRAFKAPWKSASSGVSSSTAGGQPILGEPFPNPSTGISRVILGSPNGKPIQLNLFDALGRMVRSYYSGSVATAAALEISTDGLPNGSYRLVLQSESGTASRQLVIAR